MFLMQPFECSSVRASNLNSDLHILNSSCMAYGNNQMSFNIDSSVLQRDWPQATGRMVMISYIYSSHPASCLIEREPNRSREEHCQPALCRPLAGDTRTSNLACSSAFRVSFLFLQLPLPFPLLLLIQ
jgi:hypothetical protein